MKKDMISVIVPLYNRRDVIEECINSVLAQSYQNFEIVLIDDGSSDNTPEICRELAKDEPRIKLLCGEHGGVSAARNKGLEAASGEYVFFLDSDDVIHPLLLEALALGLKNSDADIAGTEVVSVSENHWNKVREKLGQKSAPGETTYHNHQDSLRAMFGNTSHINMIGGVMMRRDLIGETRFRTDLFIGEDFYFVYQNLINGASTVLLKQKWYYARLHENNVSKNHDFSGFWTRFLRRRLVWESEEAFGRREFANSQKKDAFSVFLMCIQKSKAFDGDIKKMCDVLKENKTSLLSAMTFADKARYYLYVYMPFTRHITFKLKKVLSNFRSRK